MYTDLAVVLAAVLLLPLIIYGIIATPFWMAAQCIVSKMKSTSPYWMVIVVFLVAMIPSFFIWFLTFAAVCDSNFSGLETESHGVQIMCFLWSVVNTIYE